MSLLLTLTLLCSSSSLTTSFQPHNINNNNINNRFSSFSSFYNTNLPSSSISKSTSFNSSTQMNSTPSTKNNNPSTSSLDLTYIDGVQSIASSYTTFLLDMWGVMHNGSETYDGVINTIQQLNNKNQKTKLIILSNSSKRISNSLKMLTKLGFDPHHDFIQIITSGDVSYRMLSNDPTLQCQKWHVLQSLIESNQKKVFVLCPK